MLLVLHGPAINRSREKLLELKKKFDPENVMIFEKGAKISDILENVQTVSMFSKERLVIIENVSNEIFPKLLTINNELLTIIFWYDSEIDTKNLSKAQVLFFPEAKEVSVFPFLRFLGVRDKEAFIELDKLKRVGFESQYFITMILYLLRNLVVTPKKAAEFVRVNNIKMRKNFTSEEIIRLYKKVLEVDFKIKKGLMDVTQADFSLVSFFISQRN